jgi:hypothetical protein
VWHISSCFVIEISRKLVRGDSDYFRRCCVRKRREQRRYCRLNLTHSREHCVVLARAKSGSFGVASPRRVRGGSRNSAKHVH